MVPGSCPGRLLDLTRLVSRVGRGPMTGVDRVEFAYLTEFLRRPEPLFGLVATSAGQSLLDRNGVAGLAARINGQVAWGRPDLLARFSRSLGTARKAAESDVRRLAIGSAMPHRLAPLLRRLPEGVACYNVGHSNLTDITLQSLKALPGARVAVLIHDTIPLDHPDFTRDGQGALFRARLTRVSQWADRVICNSAQTERDVLRHLAAMGRVPERLVAHLGVVLPEPAILPAGYAALQPYFLTIGTIEPRKNHALLLDLWDGFAANPPPGGIPHLLIAGTRGWKNDAVFARLDALPATGPVREVRGADDALMAALLLGAAGLLFPSLAEGFGLPPAAAAALDIPVICNDLAVVHEVLGDYPVYASASDRYHWQTAIETLVQNWRTGQSGQADSRIEWDGTLPTWADHFNLVLKGAW